MLLVPAKRRNVSRAAVQDAGLARGRGGRDSGMPLDESMAALADPATQRRQVAGHDHPVQQRRRQPVDLHEQHAGPTVLARRQIPAARARCRTVTATRASASSASPTHAMRVVSVAASHAANSAHQKLDTETPGAIEIATYASTAWANSPMSQSAHRGHQGRDRHEQWAKQASRPRPARRPSRNTYRSLVDRDPGRDEQHHGRRRLQ